MAYRKTESGMDGSKKLYFPEGALLNQMEVAVVESERRKSEIIKEPFVVYLVESRYTSPFPILNQFKKMRCCLCSYLLCS